jgi:hypothetical protein
VNQGEDEEPDPAYTKEKFARGEFQELDNADKLSCPAFEQIEGGLQVSTSGDASQTSMAVKRIVRYETVIIDNQYRRLIIAYFAQILSVFANVRAFLFSHLLKGNAVTKSTLSAEHNKKMKPNNKVIKIRPNGYSVVFIDTNRPVDEKAQYGSHAQAIDYLRKLRDRDAKAASGMHVIPNTEINKAA